MFIRDFNSLLQFLAEVEQIIPLNGSLTNYTLLHIGKISVKTVFSGDRFARSLVFCVMFYRSLFVLLYFFFWSLRCLSFSFVYCVVCLFLLVIVLSVFFFCSLCCLSFSFGHCVVCLFLLVIVLSVFFFWSLCCLSFSFGHCVQGLSFSFGHCVVCPSLIYDFWLPLRYLLICLESHYLSIV